LTADGWRYAWAVASTVKPSAVCSTWDVPSVEPAGDAMGDGAANDGSMLDEAPGVDVDRAAGAEVDEGLSGLQEESEAATTTATVRRFRVTVHLLGRLDGGREDRTPALGTVPPVRGLL
jgi:hypothetical protein